jgi:thioredoxin-like negative regulator of GroEL
LTDLLAVSITQKIATPERPDTLFIQAQHEYLKGHWGEAQTLLNRQIDQHPRDIESRLLLATLFRHSRKLDQSLQQLKEIKRFDEGFEWNFECKREEELIREILSTQDSEKLEHSLTLESNNENEWSDAA